MKSRFALLGIIALVAVIGLAMAACGEDEVKKDEKPSISIKGTPKVGETLTATSKGDSNDAVNWWFTKTPDTPTSWVYNPDMADYEGMVDNVYNSHEKITLKKKALDYYVRASRSFFNDGRSSIATSNVIGPVTE